MRDIIAGIPAAPPSARDTRDIVVGMAIVPYAVASPHTPRFGPWAGITMRAGWVLPGGERTPDRARAQRVAQRMDEIMRADPRLAAALAASTTTNDQEDAT